MKSPSAAAVHRASSWNRLSWNRSPGTDLLAQVQLKLILLVPCPRNSIQQKRREWGWDDAGFPPKVPSRTKAQHRWSQGEQKGFTGQNIINCSQCWYFRYIITITFTFFCSSSTNPVIPLHKTDLLRTQCLL